MFNTPGIFLITSSKLNDSEELTWRRTRNCKKKLWPGNKREDGINKKKSGPKTWHRITFNTPFNTTSDTK